MADELPSLADLRRTRPKRTGLRKSSASPSPSLFDHPLHPPPEQDIVTAADVLAEQSRILRTPSAAASPRPAPPINPLPPDPRPSVYTVGQLVSNVRTLIERGYAHITVEGEISNWRPAASGHCYFTLKDKEAQLSVVLFRRQSALLRFRPKDGDAVRIGGQLSVYDSRGQLQLIAESLQQTGIGDLLAATQALKDRLRKEGVFDNARSLPPFPRCIGIVTSVHGAAFRDIIKVCRRRHAAVNLLIYPASVQGPNCPAEVAAGVRWFSTHPDRADVVIVARGGGSWEDLHGFDDEALARAIAACSVPVVTGIGHAPDSTIADSAADLCAPTPSAAAELVTDAQYGLSDHLARLRSRLLRASRYELLRTRQRVSNLAADSILRRVRAALERSAQHLDDQTFRSETALHANLRTHSNEVNRLDSRLRRQHIALRIASAKSRFDSLQQRLLAARTRPLNEAHTRLNRAFTQMEALNPLRVLERGYALVYGPSGSLLRAAAEAPEGTLIKVQLSRGRLVAKVASTE